MFLPRTDFIFSFTLNASHPQTTGEPNNSQRMVNVNSQDVLLARSLSMSRYTYSSTNLINNLWVSLNVAKLKRGLTIGANSGNFGFATK